MRRGIYAPEALTVAVAEGDRATAAPLSDLTFCGADHHQAAIAVFTTRTGNLALRGFVEIQNIREPVTTPCPPASQPPRLPGLHAAVGAGDGGVGHGEVGWVGVWPTEAEWEYACRAGSRGPRCFESPYPGELLDYAWYHENSGGQTHPVGQKKSNAWGIYDMHGNVWEWCADCYGEYSSKSVVDPFGHRKGSDRVFRGGSWRRSAEECRSATRDAYFPGNRWGELGFRVAVSPSTLQGVECESKTQPSEVGWMGTTRDTESQGSRGSRGSIGSCVEGRK